MANNTKSLDELISLQINTDWEIEEQQYELYRKICALMKNWEGHFPDLLTIFHPIQINWLILQDCWNEGDTDKSIISLACLSGYKDRPRPIYEEGQPVLNHETPIHIYAKDKYDSKTVRALFTIYDRLDVNFFDDFGNTHFHVACRHGLRDIVEGFLEQGQDPNCLKPGFVEPPLHMAVANNHIDVATLLLKAGADPNLTNDEGSTPLHVICRRTYFKSTWISCEVSSDESRPKIARTWDYTAMVKLLLRKGADPNAADAEGLTPLHIICQDKHNCLLVLRTFMKICKKKKVRLNIDARDKKGRTPLYTAVEYHNLSGAKELLLRGADPNLADRAGGTPLHLICGDGFLLAFVQEFIATSKGLRRPVDVDALDNEGKTPLQGAVQYIQPEKVDLLLDHGADLSNFVFPTVDFRDYAFKCRRPRVALHTLRIVVSLERKGYQLEWNDTEIVMRVFARFGMFDRSLDIRRRLISGEDFATIAKSYLVTLNMSLYDLLSVLTEEEEEKAETEDSKRFTTEMLPWPWSRQAIHRYPYQTVAGQFLGRYALMKFGRTNEEEKEIRRMTIKELWDLCSASATDDLTYLYRRMRIKYHSYS